MFIAVNAVTTNNSAISKSNVRIRNTKLYVRPYLQLTINVDHETKVEYNSLIIKCAFW